MFSSCKKEEGFTRSHSSGDTPPPTSPEIEITGVAALVSSANPSFLLRPSIAVSGLESGDSIKAFSDNSCSLSIAVPVTASSASETITLNTDAAIGAQEIFIQVERGSKVTECGSISVFYSRLTCPVGYAHVPSDINNGFCIMQYEAKQGGDGYPVSTPETSPWVDISANDAYSACDSLNVKNGLSDQYALPSNEEWMALSKDIESIPTNWIHSTAPDQNNVVGSGCLKQGNVGDTGDGCAYGNGSSVDFGTSRNDLAKHTLSNGEVVWDISGNVWEPVDFDKNTPGLQLAPTTCNGGAFEDIQSFVCADLPEIHWKPTHGLATTYWGMGKIHGGATGLMLRSAAYYNYSYGGIYSLYMATGPTEIDPSTGFRCVYRP